MSPIRLVSTKLTVRIPVSVIMSCTCARRQAEQVVDGTSGFIRHQQYAVCLALIIDGEVELGVIGCPNLGPEPAKLGEEVIPNGKGVVMVAVKGEGSWSASHTTLALSPRRLTVSAR